MHGGIDYLIILLWTKFFDKLLSAVLVIHVGTFLNQSTMMQWFGVGVVVKVLHFWLLSSFCHVMAVSKLLTHFQVVLLPTKGLCCCAFCSSSGMIFWPYISFTLSTLSAIEYAVFCYKNTELLWLVTVFVCSLQR